MPSIKICRTYPKKITSVQHFAAYKKCAALCGRIVHSVLKSVPGGKGYQLVLTLVKVIFFIDPAKKCSFQAMEIVGMHPCTQNLNFFQA